MGHQSLLVFRPANVVAQRVEVKRYAFELEVLEQLPHQVDDLDVLGWLAHPERFRARLEELPITTRLHPLVAKHRAKVGPARDRLEIVNRVLDIRASRGRSPFRPKREAAPRLIL